MTAAGDVDEQAFRADAATEYRSDIEGLRAVAVVLVLLFHAGVPGVAGGYVGVDVFFVISGFLITGLIVRELAATGAVSLSHFYARRARRLLPVASVVLVSVLAVSALVLPLLRITEIATDIASAVAYVSNLRFGLQANNYFRQDAAQSPVLHFWSLSVEEQFYLLWPTILLVLFRVSGRIGKPMGGVFAGVALITFVSFVASLWLTNTHGSWAFYLLPTRAWELGLGGLLAVAAPRMEGLAPAAGTGGVWVGAAMIAAAAVLFDDNTPFPGPQPSCPSWGRC